MMMFLFRSASSPFFFFFFLGAASSRSALPLTGFLPAVFLDRARGASASSSSYSSSSSSPSYSSSSGGRRLADLAAAPGLAAELPARRGVGITTTSPQSGQRAF